MTWQQPPPYGPLPGVPQKPSSTNGFAVASLIFGILGGALLSIIFGIVALRQIPRRAQRGRGLAIAGLVLSSVWILIIGVGILVAIATSAGRDDAGNLNEAGDVSAFSLRVGDCINGVRAGIELRTLPAVPCENPHESEVFAQFSLANGDWPGINTIDSEADNRCGQQLTSYAPSAADDPNLQILYLHPTKQSWAQGDRTVVCLTYDANKRTGPLRK